jgi:ubiquinone/menaquinone biosynthesis C-methylase UbiE
MVLSMNTSLAEELCFRLSKWKFLRRDQGEIGARESTFDEAAYQQWRSEELRSQFNQYFAPHYIAQKDVLDFGCGTGDLSFCVADYAPKSILGLEIVAEGIRLANERLAANPSGVPIEFRVSESSETVALPDHSKDVILCFDVLEHIMSFRAILSEWKRILRPGGKILIWWVPWFNPWGPHIESLVPLPWAHVFFSESVLIKTCARIREMNEYVPRIWDFDDDGTPLPNKWREMKELPEVNRLTIKQFENALEEEGIGIEHRDIQGFGGSALSRLSRPLTKVPVLQEYLVSCVTYVLAV